MSHVHISGQILVLFILSASNHTGIHVHHLPQDALRGLPGTRLAGQLLQPKTALPMSRRGPGVLMWLLARVFVSV